MAAARRRGTARTSHAHLSHSNGHAHTPHPSTHPTLAAPSPHRTFVARRSFVLARSREMMTFACTSRSSSSSLPPPCSLCRHWTQENWTRCHMPAPAHCEQKCTSQIPITSPFVSGRSLICGPVLYFVCVLLAIVCTRREQSSPDTHKNAACTRSHSPAYCCLSVGSKPTSATPLPQVFLGTFGGHLSSLVIPRLP